MPEKAKVIKLTRVGLPRGDRPEPERRAFEDLIDRLSNTLARASVDEIDREIETWLREIILALDVDRGTVWEREAAAVGFVATYWWARPGIPGLPPKMRSMQISPWATAQILDGRSVVYSSPEELPKVAVKLRQFLKVHGPKAQVMLPLQVGNRVLGGLTFGKFRGPRDWPADEVRRLRIAGQIIAGALDRKQVAVETRKLREEIAASSLPSTKHGARRPGTLSPSNLDLERRFRSLPARQREVFILITAGLLNKDVGVELGISERTVKVHRARLRHKMGTDSLAELARMAAILQIHPPPAPSSRPK